MNSKNPIGIFDSGVGGLSVLREIRKTLPNEDLIYVADSAYAPYGDKTADVIEARSLAISHYLLSQQCKAIVVACNTATGAAVAALRSVFSIPIIAMEPAVKPAAIHTKSGVIGVLATRRTLASDNFIQLFARYGTDVEILGQACPGLVEQVETGDLYSPKTRQLVEKYVLPLVEQGADILVLGCTHYPFLNPLIKEITGEKIAVIDSAHAVARELHRRLKTADLLVKENRIGTERFCSSDDSLLAKELITRLWEDDVEVQILPKFYNKE